MARTLADLAAVQSFRHATAPVDHALREGLVSHAILLEELNARGPFRGERRVRGALAFGDARSRSPGESLSRAVIHELGFPVPDLQRRHRDPRGGSFFTDFEWPEFKVIGEFDGIAKYFKPEYAHGRDPGEVVYEEKLRVDALRNEDNRVKRWGWHDAWQIAPVRDLLLSANLPVVRRPVWPPRGR